jgi:hypothetical protein
MSMVVSSIASVFSIVFFIILPSCTLKYLGSIRTNCWQFEYKCLMEQLYRIMFYGVMTPKMEAILLIF